MKRIIEAVVLITVTFFLAACGGESVTVVGSGGNPPQAPLTIIFDNGVVVISFGNNVSDGLISPVDNVADIEFVRWQSTPDGWGEDSTVTGVIWSDGTTFTATVVGVRPGVVGNFIVKLKTGAVAWFDLGKWRYSKNATYDSLAGGVSYSP